MREGLPFTVVPVDSSVVPFDLRDAVFARHIMDNTGDVIVFASLVEAIGKDWRRFIDQARLEEHLNVLQSLIAPYVDVANEALILHRQHIGSLYVTTSDVPSEAYFLEFDQVLQPAPMSNIGLRRTTLILD